MLIGAGFEMLGIGLLLGGHGGERDVRAVRRLVAARLAREAAVHVALLRLVVALERVEVFVVTGLLRVPRVEDGLLGLNALLAVTNQGVVNRNGITIRSCNAFIFKVGNHAAGYIQICPIVINAIIFFFILFF